MRPEAIRDINEWMDDKYNYAPLLFRKPGRYCKTDTGLRYPFDYERFTTVVGMDVGIPGKTSREKRKLSLPLRYDCTAHTGLPG